ncbi:MAG TPA: DNA gyrase subunit A [Longimicrobiales bacterium]|nr:DNA gyrase subunit A [Longimicrobiales bacterium]
MPTRRERVLPRLIEQEMRDSFLDYSMSVIVQRALPDVRDGLKPVHRRILYAMHEAGLSAGRPYKKSATVVGDVLGKYHPHGDMAVYEAMVRMVQDFAMRYPLVDGQGNFGSIDGDNAAAYRYTEARLAAVAMDLLADIEKDTVDYAPNFDDRLEEPSVLPARYPNLLVNGTSGIAVGMATNIPPHNLREVASALKHLVANPDATVSDLMRHVPGPDFPTGAYILGADGIRDAYHKGRGRIVMRAAVQKETKRGGREQLVVTALPYAVSKAKVIEQIATVARGKLDEIADLRDESDRDGMRIVIELKRGAKTQPILATLYKQTYLQATFGAIMLALDHGVPKELTLKEMLERFRDHRVEVIQRRSRHDLEKAKAEAHIVQGLLIALDYIDEVIAIIRASADQDEAASALCNSFDLSELQARAILAMRLGRLTALETDELKKELAALRKQIRELEAILGSESRQLEVLVEELDEVVAKFGDERRTTIVDQPDAFEVEDLVAEEQVVITLSHQSYIKRVPIGLYRRRVSSGRSLAGMDRYDDDFLEHVFVASTQDTLVFFTQSGQAYALAVADVPEAGPSSRGRSLAQIITMEKGDRVAALMPVAEFSEDRSLLFLTANGIVKRTSLDQYANIRSGGIAAIRVQEGDRLLDVQAAEGVNDVVLVTSQGRAIRFSENDVPLMGRVAQGVKGIQLRQGDGVVGMVVVRREATLCSVTEGGYAKRTPVSEYPSQKRGGLGTITLDVSTKTGPLVAAKELLDGDELMVITATGAAIRLAGADVPVQGRATQGKRVIGSGGDRVVEVSRVARDSDSGSRAAGGGAAGPAGGDAGAGAADVGEGASGEASSGAGPAGARAGEAGQLDLMG